MKAVEQNIERTPQGRYRARYRDVHGGRRAKTFDRLTDARMFLKKVNADVQRGEWTDPRKAQRTFAEAVELWQQSSKWRRYSPKSRARYEGVLKNHVLPRLGRVQLARIDYATLTKFLAALEDEGMTPSSVRKVWEAVRAPLVEAIRAKWITADPTTGIELPSRPKTDMLFLTPAEVRDLAEAITPRYRAVIYFAAYSGLRAGEVWGLRVKDLDLLRGKVHVRRALVDDRGAITFGLPKHGKTRTVPIPVMLRELLAEHVAAYVGSPADPDALVFTSEEGEPVRHSNFIRRHFHPAVKGQPARPRRRGTAGSPEVPPALPEAKLGLRFHDLRHSFASILISTGAHPKAVSDRLGHSSITITMDRYSHLLPSVDEEVTDALDAAFRAAGEAQPAEVRDLRAAGEE